MRTHLAVLLLASALACACAFTFDKEASTLEGALVRIRVNFRASLALGRYYAAQDEELGFALCSARQAPATPLTNG